MSKNLPTLFGIDELEAIRDSYKKEDKLRHREITDKLLQLALDRMSIEDRYRVLYYYIFNDIQELDS